MSAEIRFYIGDYASLGPFQLDKAISLGRGLECGLMLPDDGLSRIHCRVEPRVGCVLVRDLGSQNGLYHNGQRVDQAVIVYGDEFWIGHTRARVGRVTDAAKPLPLPPAEPPTVTPAAPIAPPVAPSLAPPAEYEPVVGESTMVMANPPVGALVAPAPGTVAPAPPPPSGSASVRPGPRTGTEVDRPVPEGLDHLASPGASSGPVPAPPPPPAAEPPSPPPSPSPPPPSKKPKSGRHGIAPTTPQLAPPVELFGDLPSGSLPLGAPPPLPLGAPPPLPPGADLSSVPPLATIAPRPGSDGSLPSAQVAPIRVYVDGIARPLTGLDLHVAQGEEGMAYLRLVARFDDPILGPQEAQIWLAGH